MNTDQIELKKAIKEQIKYHEKWYSLLSWKYVGRDVDFGEFDRKYPDYDIKLMIENLKWELKMVSLEQNEDILEKAMLQAWACFYYLMDEKQSWY